MATRKDQIAARIKRAHDDGFAAGVAWAAAFLVRGHGENCLAGFVLGESGIPLEDFRRAKVAGYDLRVVSRLFRDEPFLDGGDRP